MMKTSQRKRNFVKNTRKSKTQKKFIGAKKRKKDSAPKRFRKISTEYDTYYYNVVMAGAGYSGYSLKIISKNSEKHWILTDKETNGVTDGIFGLEHCIASPYFVRYVIEKLIIKDGKAERKAQKPKNGSLYIFNGDYGTVRIRRINGKQIQKQNKQNKQNKNYDIFDFNEPNWTLCYLNGKFLYNETAFSVMKLNPNNGDICYHVKKPFMVLEKCDVSDDGDILPNSFTAVYNVYKILTFENRIRYICFPLYTNFTNIFTFLS